MELLAGPSLRERLDQGALPIPEALAIARDVASALAYAHRRGTSHRDVKPENLMFDEHGAIQIMDFGLARATMASRLTVTGTQLGTPAYMSPESLRGEAGPTSDVFALGLVLWEMLTGRRAFQGDNSMAVMFMIANQDPPSVRELRPEVTEATELLIGRMLDKDASTRIDAAGAARTLAELTGVSVSNVIGPDESSRSAVPGRGGRTPNLRRRVLIASFAAVVLLGVGGIAWIGAQGGRNRDRGVQLFERSLAALRAGQNDDARGLLEQAIVADPANADVLSRLGLIAVEEGRYASADSLFEAMRRHHPKDKGVLYAYHLDMGASFSGRGMFDEAVQSYQAGLVTDSSRAEAYNNLGWALIQNRQAQDAVGILARGVDRFPGEPYLRKNMGLALLQLGDPAAALIQFERAIALDSTLTEAVTLKEQALRATAGAP
jgi:tetratricopeptide (TPR) repeat protein